MRIVSLIVPNIIMLIFLYHNGEYCYAGAYIHIHLCAIVCVHMYIVHLSFVYLQFSNKNILKDLIIPINISILQVRIE